MEHGEVARPDPAALRRRAEAVLLQLALVSEGAAQTWDPGHGQPGSRAPTEDVAPAHEGPPPKDRSLHDHWAWRFTHARDDQQLYWYVLLAEEDLIRARKSPPARTEIREERLKRILATRGTPERVAAGMRINIAHVRALREEHGLDPETGVELPEDREARIDVARRLIADEGASEREAARRVGVPRSTLQRRLHDSA